MFPNDSFLSGELKKNNGILNSFQIKQLFIFYTGTESANKLDDGITGDALSTDVENDS